MSRIAILGLGAMGSRMAQSLLTAHHPVVVYNRTADKATSLINQGAVYAATPRAAAEQADIVISMVTDDEASRTVWLDPQTGAALGLGSGKIAIESSTLTVAWVRELAAMLTRHQADFLEAPVVGSLPQADAHQLIYLVGGSAETLTVVYDILRCMGSMIHHVGSTGEGMALKLAANALFGIQVAALSEVLGLLTKQGLTSTTVMDCLGALPVISPAAKGAGSLILAHNHAPLFPMGLVEKDFRYLLHSAQAVDAATPTTSAIHSLYQTAIARGLGNDNITGIAQLFL